MASENEIKYAPLKDSRIEHLCRIGAIIIGMGSSPDSTNMAVDVRILRRTLSTCMSLIEYLEKSEGLVDPKLADGIQLLKRDWRQYRKATDDMPKKPATPPKSKVKRKKR
jgi:hypothetical protein